MPKGDHLKAMKLYNKKRVTEGKEKLSRSEYFKRRKEGTLETETPVEVVVTEVENEKTNNI